MLRCLEVADYGAVRRHAEALAVNRYPEMLPDPSKMHDILAAVRTDSSQYAKVAGPVGEPEAALIAKAGNLLWSSRRQASVLLWYSRRGDAGIELLRDFRRWAMEQKSIVVAGMMDDYGMDERIQAVLRRVGFVQRGGMWAVFPRGVKK